MSLARVTIDIEVLKEDTILASHRSCSTCHVSITAFRKHFESAIIIPQSIGSIMATHLDLLWGKSIPDLLSEL